MIIGTHRHQAHRALLSAFTPEEFSKLLKVSLEVSLDRLTPASSSMNEAVFIALTYAEQAGWLPDLVKAAYEARPENPELAALYQSFGFASPLHVRGMEPLSDLTSDPGLESVLVPNTGMHAPEWRTHLRDIEPRICRVECLGMPRGTGFLVGPNAILTAFCVVEDLVQRSFGPGALRFRFDYKGMALGADSGTVIDPDEKWLSCHSGELDFALISLRPGALGVDGGGKARGWIPMPVQPVATKLHDPLVIALYPKQLRESLTISLAFKGITKLDMKTKRLFHSAETEPGAAGAPCFDRHFNLIAMHHAKEKAKRGAQGEAVDALAIREAIQASGMGGFLGGINA